SEPVANHADVEAELAQYGAGLEALPRILALCKADLVPPERAGEAAREWRERLGPGVLEVVVTSAATGEGLEELAAALLRHAPEEETAAAGPSEAGELAEHRVYRPGASEGFGVERTGPGAFRVTGAGV